MSEQGSCINCADELLYQGKPELSEVVRRLGGEDKPEWCKVCKRLWVEPQPLYPSDHELAIELVEN